MAAAWLVLSAAFGITVFLHSSRSLVVASHDSVVSPTLSGHIVLHTGAVLPDLRVPSGTPIGVDVVLGKTQAASTEELVQRYAFIGSQPQGQVAAVEAAVRGLALSAALRGGVLALVPIGLWLLVGRARRAELLHAAAGRRGAAVLVGAGLLTVLVVQPWRTAGPGTDPEPTWTSLSEFAGTSLPEDLADVEVTTDVTTTESRRLVLGAIDTYRQSRTWYAAAAEVASGLAVRTPEPGETVAVLVSDRHDNVGMDLVARAIGDAGGATVVLDAGDDTSTGGSWEAFSLDSLDRAFADYTRYAVAGNHDHGTFVSDYLAELGWTHLEGEAVEGPGQAPIWGIDDPRSSGLGSWRDEPGATFAETEQLVADEVCAEETRVATMLVHDANLGREALRRGCVDLVLGGHLHVQSGPTGVEGENGEIGYTYTTGTTGGATYAIAVGAKPRRPAGVTLVTYRDGRPSGVQAVELQTTGSFVVGPWVALRY